MYMTVFGFCNSYLPQFAAQVADDNLYGQLYWCTQGSPVEIHTATHSNPIGRRFRYRPAVFFHHLRPTELSIPQGKIRRAFQRLYYFNVFFFLISVNLKPRYLLKMG
jgi:hypothetical protein